VRTIGYMERVRLPCRHGPGRRRPSRRAVSRAPCGGTEAKRTAAGGENPSRRR
jgi:hypothetical protein